jgi:chromosome segregation ATPase
MGKFVGVCVGLFVLAVGFVALTQGPQMAALINAFFAEPPLHKIAWGVIVLVPLAMLPFAVWLWDTLVRQRQTAKTLESRLDGVRQDVKDLAATQADADVSVQHLTLTDPEDAIRALKHRVMEAERFADVQRRRHEDKDLNTRIETIRTQQQALKERLSPLLDARRSIENVFLELDSQQSDIDRALSEIASGDDAIALDLRLKNLMEFVRRCDARCDQIEQASKTVATLAEACADLRTRLGPFAAARDGMTSRVRELTEQTEKLAAEMEVLERTPEGPLADRVQKLNGDKRKLEEDLSRLDGEFSKLGNLRRDVSGLFAAFDRALNTLSIAKGEDTAAGVDARIDDLTRFIERTHIQFDDIARRAVVFGQLKTRLGELQTRLTPLESDDGGVVNLIEDLHDIRERLIVKIRRIEGGEEGDLAARVKLFADSKRELEERVSSLADQFTKLATVRKDIAGLFDKLSSAVSASSG